MRPRHDLSHPARTKKQIDASSHYNSLPPLPSLRRAMLYPPGIARQIKHHLLSEHVDLDLTAPSTAHGGAAGGCIDDRDAIFRSQRAPRVRASPPREHFSHDATKTVARDSYGERVRKFVAAKGPGVLGLRVRA